jgi:hypothetical protein
LLPHTPREQGVPAHQTAGPKPKRVRHQAASRLRHWHPPPWPVLFLILGFVFFFVLFLGVCGTTPRLAGLRHTAVGHCDHPLRRMWPQFCFATAMGSATRREARRMRTQTNRRSSKSKNNRMKILEDPRPPTENAFEKGVAAPATHEEIIEVCPPPPMFRGHHDGPKSTREGGVRAHVREKASTVSLSHLVFTPRFASQTGSAFATKTAMQIAVRKVRSTLPQDDGKALEVMLELGGGKLVQVYSASVGVDAVAPRTALRMCSVVSIHRRFRNGPAPHPQQGAPQTAVESDPPCEFTVTGSVCGAPRRGKHPLHYILHSQRHPPPRIIDLRHRTP